MLEKVTTWIKTLICSHCYHTEKVEKFNIKIKPRCKQASPYEASRWRVFQYCCLCPKKKEKVKLGHLTRSEFMIFYGREYYDREELSGKM